MALELVKALLTIVRHCTACQNCAECPMKDFCGQTPQTWGE